MIATFFKKIQIRDLQLLLIFAFIASVFIKGFEELTNTLVFLIPVLSIIDFLKNKNKLDLRNKFEILGICLFFIFQSLTLIYANNKDSGLELLIQRIPLLSFPILFLFLNLSKKETYKILIFLSFVIFIASFMGFTHGIYLALKFEDSGFLYNDNISDLFFGMQAVYFSFYVNTSIFILLFFILIKKEIYPKRKLLFGIMTLWLFFMSVMLASKASMISLVVISVMLILYTFIVNKKIYEVFVFLFSCVIIVFLIHKISPKTLNRFKGLMETSYNYKNENREYHFNEEFNEKMWNSTNTRAAIWSCAYDVWKEHFYLGNGIGNGKNALLEKYKEKEFAFALKTKKNTHNQYLDIAIDNGLLGLILFITLLIVFPLVRSFESSNILAIVILSSLSICFCTENMLNRYQGIILISLIIPLALSLNKKEVVN